MSVRPGLVMLSALSVPAVKVELTDLSVNQVGIVY